MAKIYYIDSENVGDSWIELLEESEARFLVFYTGHSPRIAYPQAIQLMNATTKPEFIECHEGNNGLDFQLVTYLGYELHADNTNEIIIVSNDTGFDAVVSFWSERGMNVSRVARSITSNSKPIEIPVSDEEVVVSTSSVKVTEKINGIDKNEIYTIINCVGKNDPSYIHLALVHFYGNKNGENIYKALKKVQFEAPAVQWKKDTKLKKFIELILLHMNTSKVEVPESFPGYLAKNIVDDKKSMSAKITKQYPKNGAQLNKIFKPFYKTLAKIKK